MLQFVTFIFSPFMENTYLVWDSESKEAAVIDPGCCEPIEEDKLSQFIEDKGLTIKYLLNTHCHVDHIFGNKFVKDKYDAKFIIPKEDEFLLDKAIEQSASFGIKSNPQPQPDSYFEEELELFLGEIKIETIFTPGHTPGEYCFYFLEDKKCFTGDVLFREGIGRTDLWGGDFSTLVDSIQNKLFTLPGDVEIYPGHGISSTIDYEKVNNPFLI